MEFFLGGLPGRYQAADGPCSAQGCIFTLNSDTGLCTDVERIEINSKGETGIMSVEKVRAYLEPYGVADRIREFDVSSATVELAAQAVGVEAARIAKTLCASSLGEGCVLVVAAGDATRRQPQVSRRPFGAKAKMLTADEALARDRATPWAACVPSPCRRM